MEGRGLQDFGRSVASVPLLLYGDVLLHLINVTAGESGQIRREKQGQKCYRGLLSVFHHSPDPIPKSSAECTGETPRRQAAIWMLQPPSPRLGGSRNGSRVGKGPRRTSPSPTGQCECVSCPCPHASCPPVPPTGTDHLYRFLMSQTTSRQRPVLYVSYFSLNLPPMHSWCVLMGKGGGFPPRLAKCMLLAFLTQSGGSQRGNHRPQRTRIITGGP